MALTQRYCDLHLHTKRSDGTLTPAEVVRAAGGAGIFCVAVTDHDTVSGIDEAVRAGESLGVEVIPGIEISADFTPGILHLLGYGIRWKDPAFEGAIRRLQADRRARNKKIIERLSALGIAISLEEVAGDCHGNQISRLHFARVLVRKGIVSDKEAAFRKFLGQGRPAYVSRAHISSKEAISLIRGAGGVAALAHPLHMGLPLDSREFLQTIQRLQAEGIMGLEVYSSAHDKTSARRLFRLAETLRLLPTGGSDFHGDHKNIPIGYSGEGGPVPYEWAERLKKQFSMQKSV